MDGADLEGQDVGTGHAPRRRGRVTALLGLLAALAVAASGWLPWFLIDIEGASELEQASREELVQRRKAGQPISAEEDLVEGVRRAAESGAIRGTDLASWFATMARARPDLAPEAPDVRRFAAISRTINGLLLGAALLVLLHLFGLARGIGALALGLSTVIGVLALGVGLLLRAIIEESGGRGLEAVGSGGHLLLGGGALLIVVGLLGVTRSTWWKAWLLAVIGMAGVVLWAMKAFAIRA